MILSVFFHKKSQLYFAFIELNLFLFSPQYFQNFLISGVLSFPYAADKDNWTRGWSLVLAVWASCMNGVFAAAMDAVV